MYVLKMLKYSRVRGKRGFLGCLRARARTDCNLISEDDRAMRLSGPDGMGSETAAGGGSANKMKKKKRYRACGHLTSPDLIGGRESCVRFISSCVRVCALHVWYYKILSTTCDAKAVCADDDRVVAHCMVVFLLLRCDTRRANNLLGAHATAHTTHMELFKLRFVACTC